jgi:hypothetical protein
MDAVVSVPSWAYDFCYYYLALAVVSGVFTVTTLVSLFMLPASVRKSLPYPVWVMVAVLLLNGLVTVVLTMMQFWICRSALNPSVVAKMEGFLSPLTKQQHTKKHPSIQKTTEKFAVACTTTGDCQSASSDTTSGCTCGSQGFCAGCIERNTQGATGGDYPGWGADFGEAFSNQSISKSGRK